MLLPVKLLLPIVFLLSASCFAQHSWNTGEPAKFQLMVPNIGPYYSHPTALVDWVNRNGGRASAFTHGGDFFNVTFVHKSFICGISTGGLYSNTTNSYLRLGYGEFIGGIKLVANNWLQVNIVGHASFLDYTVNGIIPSTISQPINGYGYYISGTTVGAGPSLQIRIKLVELSDGGFVSFGAEVGKIFMDPDPHWVFKYQYNYPSSNYRYSRTTIDGPQADSALSYLRFSLVFNFH